ncbi:hypothetical protein [Nocardia sp. CA-135398]|uniref:hypothetical protein n=1 Tax=Nocardia sp. CA-135398 TaxID=3239977 RepID=UPI003D985F05
MRGEVRAFLVAVAAAAVVGAVSVPMAMSEPSTTTPSPTISSTTTGQAGSCPTTPTAVGETCKRPDPTFNGVPSRAERGTRFTVSGDNWRCTEVRITPSWSGSPQNATVSQGSFETSIDVSNQAATGPQTISAACGWEESAVRQITIAPRSGATTTTTTKPVTTTTTKPVTTTTTKPIATSTTQAAVVEPSDTPTAGPTADDPQRGNHVGGALGIGVFLLAVGVATLVLRRRRKQAVDPSRPARSNPRPPLVSVQVAGASRPLIHIREFMRRTVPAVRVRLSVGEPQLQVREVSR